ncbi:DUF4870 domain-containing protein [Protaetiibacter intestinalis]|uniref:DUF4870 domain-containing protein n=1 Tax=Protaetiibacter intestinalis TaxID=2419774 RepID=A0A387B546_9MICO|nr:DUF4870 domain-containing protein [Protaetiibacter intestinalis]AYF96868.1 DUF4870 domain-containing protein [Protaetiibacter intestinalis]
MTATPPPPADAYQQAPQPMSPADERLWSTLTHVGALVLSGSGVGWLLALIAYLVLRDRGPFVRSHTATELNFQLTLLIAYAAGVLTLIAGIGFVIVIAAAVLAIVLGIIAAVKANKGEYYLYPVAIRFVS